MKKTNKNKPDFLEIKIIKAKRKLIKNRIESRKRKKEFDKKFKALMKKCRKIFILCEISRAKRMAFYKGISYLFPKDEIEEIRKVFRWP
ncbi:MAG: hypothetical protein ACD_12C00894G0001 [uncultured bacterium]|nr:MAG: hypothetical protein ACD_12C00894G0001 [uncultured bacterium]